MTVVRYLPSDAAYFDHVLLDLSRAFIIGEQSSVEHATSGVVLRLLTTHVLAPLRLKHQDVYRSAAPTFPAVASYRQQYYSYEPSAATSPKHPKTALARALIAA